MEGYCKSATGTGQEGSSKEERRLEEGDRGGHSPKTDQSTIEEEK